MGKLGVLYYEVKLKDSMSTGLSTIERKIKRMSATISPKISAPDLNRQIKNATDKLKVANIQVNVVANTSSLGGNIQAAVNAGTYVAKIGADTNGLIQTIQEAINKATFTAKVAKVDVTTNGKKGTKGNEQTVAIKADTSTLAASIQKAVSAQAYVAKINADTNGFVSAVQSALAASSFTAKVNIDKTALTNATQGKKSADGTSATQSKDSSYSVDVKAKASTLRQSIKEAINGGEYKVNIEAKAQNLRKSIKDAINNGEYKAKVEANTSALQKGVRDALKTGEYVAKIGADASGIVSTIQKAITASSFTAKVNLDNSAFSRTGKNSNLTDPKKNVQAYSVDVTAKASSLQKSIKDAIKAGDYKAKIGADTSMLANAIQRYINQQTFTAKVSLTNQSSTTNQKKKAEEVTDTTKKRKKDEPIKVDVKVDASSAPKTIQDAINSKPYTAKVGADTTQLVDAINKAIPQEKKIQITGAVASGSTGTTGGTTSGSTSSSGSTKSENDAKAAQRAVERQQKAESKAYENHLKGMQKMRDTYEKDKYTAIRKMGMSAPKAAATTISLGNGNGTNYVNNLVSRIDGIKETIRQYRGEIAKLDKLNAQLVNKIGSGPIMGMKKENMNRELQKNLSWIQAYKNEIQSLEKQYRTLSKINIQQPQRFTLPSTFVGYGGTPANHNAMQRQWEEHFAWKDQTLKATSAGNMRMSADEAKKEARAAIEAKNAEIAKQAAIKAAAEQRRLAAQDAKRYATEMQRVASEMNNVGSRSGWLRDQLQNVFSMYGVQQFLQNLIMIGGEFEKQKIALGSIFKNTAKGNETFEQIKQWSVKSPFTFSNLTSYTKQLASFGFQYRDVFETTKKLADISAGVGVDMGRIILAYGQVYTAHYLRGQELRQFTEAGIPMVDELSKVLTERMGKKVSAGDVFKLISDKQVEFEDVKKVIDKITGDGGTFYKMQEKQSESLAGKWTNLKDAIEIMYSDVEFANKGILKGAITMLTKLALHWKGVGISVLAVASAYGLLALKNRLVYATASREASLIATMDAKKAAIDSQTMSYNRLAEAIAKKNYVESETTMGAAVGYGGAMNRYTNQQRNAAARMATRLALNGADPRSLTPIYVGATQATQNSDGSFTYKGQIDKGIQKQVRDAAALRLHIERLKMQTSGLAKNWKLFGLQSAMAFQNFKLSAQGALASVLALGKAMLPMMAITAAIGGIMYWRQNKAEQENRTKEMIDGAKSSYKEVSDFLRDNPIEIHIQKMDKEDISGIIDTYKEQARNSPINIDFAIANANNMSDYAEQLKYLRTQLEYVAMAEKYAADNGKGIADSIKDSTETSLWGWFDDDYAENVKDYAESIEELKKKVSAVSESDINGLIKDLGDKGSESANKLRKSLIELQKEGASTEKKIEAIYNSGFFKYGVDSMSPFYLGDKIQDAAVAYSDVYRKDVPFQKDGTLATMDADSQVAVDKIRQKLEAIPNALDANGRLTDLGHTMMVRLAQSIGEDAGLVKEQIDLIVGDFEGKFQPSMQASWQDSSQAMNALMDQMRANCADLFQGMDLSNGFTEEQRKAIQACIDNAPAECKKYTKVWQRLLDQHQLYIRVGAYFNATGLPRQTQSSLQSIWNTRYKNNKDYAKYAPSKDDTMVSWGDARKKNIEDNKKELARLLKAKRTPQSQVEIYQRQEDIKKETKVWKDNDPYGYSQYEEEQRKKNKKGGKNTNKNNTKNDPNKEQREREANLRKEFSQIKRVRSMYEKLRGLYGDVGAIERIRKSGLISESLIPDNVTDFESFVSGHYKIMKRFYNSYKATTDGLKDLNSQVAEELMNVKYDQQKEALDKAVSTLETQLERAGDAWTRYKNLLSEGVNMPLAKFMVYGEMGNYNMADTDDTGSQRLSMLRERAAKHIEEKTKATPSDYNMDRYLGMNEEELKTEFGNNEEVTKGLWAIVKTYQEVAKNIRSENDKLISQLYKDSLSYAGQMESIARKHKQERATIKEKQVAYAPAKARYDKAVQQGANIEGRRKYQQGLAENTKEYRDWNLADFDYRTAKDNLAWHDEQVKKGEKPNTNRANLQKAVNEAKVDADKAWNIYISTDAYKGIASLEEEQKKNAEEQKIAKEKLSDTLPPDVANGLLAQSKINERNEKSDVSVKMLEGSDGYIQLFNNIYNLAADKANDIADALVRILDDKLAKGEITQADYNKMRGEISNHRNEVYEKGTDSKNNSLWQVGFGGITKNKIQQSEAAKNTAGAMMESISKQMDDIDADTTMSSVDKIGKKGFLQAQYNKAKEDYEKADQEGNAAAKKQAKQDMIQGGFGMAANMGQNLTQFRDTLGGTLDAFGVDTENNEGFQKFSTAVDVMSDVSSGMSNAMQSMMSGDFVGAAFSIIETPMNIANAFAKLHDKKLDIQINQSKQLMEEVQTASEDLKNAIQSSLGSEDAKNRALSRQGEMAQILSDAGVKDTEGAGFVYNMVSGKTSGSDLISQNRNKYYGKDGKVTDQAYRKKFSFGKFLLNTVALTGSQPITAPTTMAAGVTADASTGGMSGLTATTAAATKVASDSVTGLVKAVKGSFTLVKNEEAKAYTRMADSLEKAGFGNHSQVSVYGAEYASLLEQRKQAEYQMKMEQDKSNTDDDKIKEYKSKIKELNQQIHEYMTNLAKELYGIDFTSWANKLGDALTNAFRNGEDAAASFHDAVGDIMADLVKNMIITDAIKPMFTKLEETLFGKDDDMSGMLDVNDMEGSIKKAVPYISSFFNDVENSVPGWQKLYDVLDEASGGIVKKTSSSSSSMSGSIKGITEETSTLLASYINAIRLDVSVNRKTFKDLAEVTIPKMSVIAENQLRQLNVIAEQTTKIEENTRRNAESVELIKSYISSVSTTTSGGKAIRMKE